MRTFKINANDRQDGGLMIAKRMFFLAWQACGGPLGMGIFQNRPKADENDVFVNVRTSGDYSSNHSNKSDEAYGDYVFGRMMKWGCSWNENLVHLRFSPYNIDYQSFARTYKDDQALLEAAAKSLGLEISEVK